MLHVLLCLHRLPQGFSSFLQSPKNMPIVKWADKLAPMCDCVCVIVVSHSRCTYFMLCVSGDMVHDPERDKAITEDERMNEFTARHVTSNYSSRVLQNTIPAFTALEIADCSSI